MTVTADSITAEVDRVDADLNAGTRKGSHTLQTRRVAAGLRALGLKRSEFRARVTYDGRENGVRIYGHAIGSPRTEAGSALVRQYAQELADAGFRVHLVGERSNFIASGYPGAVIDHRRIVEEANA